jgi:hypothetical protein
MQRPLVPASRYGISSLKDASGMTHVERKDTANMPDQLWDLELHIPRNSGLLRLSIDGEGKPNVVRIRERGFRDEAAGCGAG